MPLDLVGAIKISNKRGREVLCSNISSTVKKEEDKENSASILKVWNRPGAMAMALLKTENKLGLKTQELKRIKMSLIYVKEYKDTNYKDNGEH